MSTAFLDAAEEARFDRDYHHFPRTIQRLRDAGDGREGGSGADRTFLVEGRVGQWLKAMATVQSQSQARIWIGSILVREGDGADWTATAVDRAVTAGADQIRLSTLHFNQESVLGGLPEFASIVGVRTFARMAQKTGVTTSFRILSPWLHPLLAIPAGAVAVTLAKIAADRLPKNAGFTAYLTPSVLILALAAAAATVLVQMLGKARTAVNSKELIGLAAELETAREGRGRQGGRAYQALIGECARWLTGHHARRCVLINRFGDLDEMTQDILLEYLTSWRESTRNLELWVIVESGQETFFGKAVDSAGGADWIRQITRYEQRPLTPEQRTRLAEYSNLPDRADFTTVRAIRHKAADTAGAVEQLMQPFDRRARRGADNHYEPVDLFYVLALGAANGDSPQLPFEVLYKRLTEKTGLRASVLRLLLPGTGLNRSEIRGSLAELRETFRRFLEWDEEKSYLRVEATCGQFLAERHEKYGLASPLLAHFYWALLCRDVAASPRNSAFWVRKLSSHLLKTRSVGMLGLPESLSGDAQSDFAEAILLAVGECLDWCVLGPIPDLLEAAHDTASGETDAGFRRRLRLLTWRAYSLLGDDRVFQVALSLESTSKGGRAAKSLMPATDALFLAAVPVPRSGSVGRDDLVRALGRSPVQAQLFARSWTTYFSALVRSHDLAAKLPLISGANGEAMEELPALLAATCDRLMTAFKPEVSKPEASKPKASKPATRSVDLNPHTVDLLGLSVGLWALTRESCGKYGYYAPSQRRQLLTAVESSYVMLLEIEDQRARREAREGPDVILGLLISELWAVLGSCALDLAEVAPAAGSDRLTGPEKELGNIVREAVERLTDRTGRDPRMVIRKRLELLVVVYDSLRLARLSSLANMRAAELSETTSRAGPVDILQHDLDKPGTTGLLSLAMAAMSSYRSAEVAARFWTGLAERAVDARLSGELVEELILLAIVWPTSAGQDHSGLLAYLINRADSDRLHRTLLGLPADSLHAVTLSLLNAVRITRTEDDDRFMLSLLGRLAAELNESPAARQIVEELDVFTLQARIAGRTVEPDEVLRTWPEKHGRNANYAWLLKLLLDHHPPGPAKPPAEDAVAEEADAMLAGFDGYALSNGYFLLAITMAEQCQFRADEDPTAAARLKHAVDVLDQSIDQWERNVSVDTNIRALRILHTRAGTETARAGYKQRLVDWDVHRLERDRIGLLPLISSEGRYFMLYRHYIKTLVYWYLPIDGNWADVLPLLTPSETERAEVLRAWRERGEPIPAPFTGRGQEMIFAADFLVTGSALFDSNGPEQDFDDGRMAFNEAARESLPTLYRLLTTVSSLPIEIRTILEQHQRSMVDSALPDDFTSLTLPRRPRRLV